jgi:hypothetical protein
LKFLISQYTSVVSGMDGARNVCHRGVSRAVSWRGWPDPPPFPPQYALVAAMLADWTAETGVPAYKLQILQGLLGRDYLLAIPPPAGARAFDATLPEGPQLRFRFRKHAALLLGWKSRREEGSADGFPDALNYALRTIVYP